MMPHKIPFNRPAVVGREMDYITECVLQGHTAGDGPYCARTADFLQSKLGPGRVFLTPSGTAALELGLLALGLKPGDEVLIPSFTFVSTANAIARFGAKPVFVDIHRDNLNIDESLIPELINERSRGIVPVHYAGIGCHMAAINELAAKHKLFVLEDAAHALFSSHRGRPLGAWGDAGAFSFHETKNFTCGEGGALFVPDAETAARAEIIRDKGTNRRAFLSGQVDKYTWVESGSNYHMSDISAAFLFGQLEQWEMVLKRRREIHALYHQGLSHLAARGDLRQPPWPAERESNYHIYYITLPDSKTREALRTYLLAQGVSAVFHYIPLHSSPYGKLFHDGRSLPVTDEMAACLLRLPVYYGLNTADQERVIQAICEFFQAPID